MRNKRFTRDVIGHVVWQPYWIYPKTYKNLILQNGSTNRGETWHKCSPSHGCTSLLRNNWSVTWFGSHIGFKKILNNVFSGIAYSIKVKLHIYDQVVMGNICFKFQLDQMHGLAARKFFFNFFFGIRLTWLCLDGFEGIVAAEIQILSRFHLMTSSLLFACLGSFWLLQCMTVPIWSSIWFELNLF